MKVAAIVQARMTSTRLPGKVMKRLAGRTVLEHVMTRVGRTSGVDVTCCAVPAAAASSPLLRECERLGVEVFQGSEHDVLARYAGAARALDADLVMRVTSDCPLSDPEVNAAVLRACLEHDADYACNNLPPSWPHGLDCEVFSRAWLERAATEAHAADEREHVTPWLRRHDALTRINVACPAGDLKHHRWTLDTPDDWDFFVAVFARLGAAGVTAGWEHVLSLIERHPELAALNAASVATGR